MEERNFSVKTQVCLQVKGAPDHTRVPHQSPAWREVWLS